MSSPPPREAQRLRLLDQMRVDRQVYVLGCHEKRITLYSQQVRALNLIYALWGSLSSDNAALRRNRHVGIVGAGVAGLTAAAAALSLGCRVTLLEEMPEPLHILAGSRHRWLHPSIYDWPDHEPLPAPVPFLGWRAAWADEVREQLINGWEKFRAEYGKDASGEKAGRLVEEYSVPGARVVRDGEQLTLWWGPLEQEPVDCVILAVGFGPEKDCPPIPGRSYWQGDDLDRLHRGTHHIFVSGSGDGGITDVLRSRFSNFRHDQLVEDFVERSLRPQERRELKEQLRIIEQGARARSADRQDASAYLTKRYNSLTVPATLHDRLKARLRKDTRTTLHGRSHNPLGPHSSVLNRFLLSRLLKIRALDYVFGEIDKIEEYPGPPRSYRIRVRGVRAPVEADDVIIRHGPRPALMLGFPDYYREKAASLESFAQLDLTRAPIWPDGWWENPGNERLESFDSEIRVQEGAGESPVEDPSALETSGVGPLGAMGQEARGPDEESRGGSTPDGEVISLAGPAAAVATGESSAANAAGEAGPDAPAERPQPAPAVAEPEWNTGWWCRFDLAGLAQFVDPDAAKRFFSVETPVTGRLKDRAQQVYARILSERLLWVDEDTDALFRRIRGCEAISQRMEATGSEFACLYAALCAAHNLLPVLVLVNGRLMVALSLRYSNEPTAKWIERRGQGESPSHSSDELPPLAVRREAEPFWSDLSAAARRLPELIESGDYLLVDTTGAARPAAEEGASVSALEFEAAVASALLWFAGWQPPRDGAVDLDTAHSLWGLGPSSTQFDFAQEARVLSAGLRLFRPGDDPGGQPLGARFRASAASAQASIKRLEYFRAMRDLLRQVQQIYDRLRWDAPSFPDPNSAGDLLGHTHDLRASLVYPRLLIRAEWAMEADKNSVTAFRRAAGYLSIALRPLTAEEEAWLKGGMLATTTGGAPDSAMHSLHTRRLRLDAAIEAIRNTLSAWAQDIHARFCQAWREPRLGALQEAVREVIDHHVWTGPPLTEGERELGQYLAASAVPTLERRMAVLTNDYDTWQAAYLQLRLTGLETGMSHSDLRRLWRELQEMLRPAYRRSAAPWAREFYAVEREVEQILQALDALPAVEPGLAPPSAGAESLESRLRDRLWTFRQPVLLRVIELVETQNAILTELQFAGRALAQLATAPAGEAR